MANLLLEDFNDETLDGSLTVTSTAIAHGFDTDPVLEGSHSYRIETGANDSFELYAQGLTPARSAASDPVLTGCGLYIPSASTSRLSLLAVASASSVQFGHRFCGARILANGTIEGRAAAAMNTLGSGINLGSTASGVFPFDEYVYLETQAVFGNGTAGSLDIFLDGSSVFSVSGVDNITGSNAPETLSGGGFAVITLLTGTGSEEFWIDYLSIGESETPTGGPSGGGGGATGASQFRIGLPSLSLDG